MLNIISIKWFETFISDTTCIVFISSSGNLSLIHSTLPVPQTHWWRQSISHIDIETIEEFTHSSLRIQGSAQAFDGAVVSRLVRVLFHRYAHLHNRAPTLNICKYARQHDTDDYTLLVAYMLIATQLSILYLSSFLIAIQCSWKNFFGDIIKVVEI